MAIPNNLLLTNISDLLSFLVNLKDKNDINVNLAKTVSPPFAKF